MSSSPNVPVMGLMLASFAAAVEASCHSLVMVLGGAGARSRTKQAMSAILEKCSMSSSQSREVTRGSELVESSNKTGDLPFRRPRSASWSCSRHSDDPGFVYSDLIRDRARDRGSLFRVALPS